MIIKNVSPNEFFITKGFGTSNLEKHAGAYHMALWDAGIADYNIQVYSSVLSATSELLTLDEIDMPPHGCELQTIMSCVFGEFGQHISAGIIYAWLYEDENLTTKKGGLVCEVSGHYTTEVLEERLYKVLEALYEDTYKTKGLFMGEPTTITQSGSVPNDVRFGCALVSICFINHKVSEE